MSERVRENEREMREREVIYQLLFQLKEVLNLLEIF